MARNHQGGLTTRAGQHEPIGLVLWRQECASRECFGASFVTEAPDFCMNPACLGHQAAGHALSQPQ